MRRVALVLALALLTPPTRAAEQRPVAKPGGGGRT